MDSLSRPHGNYEFVDSLGVFAVPFLFIADRRSACFKFLSVRLWNKCIVKSFSSERLV